MNNDIEISKLMNKIKFDDIKKDVSEMSNNVPFGNSIFQNTEILKNKEITRGRKIRMLLLNLSSKIKTLDELKISLEKHTLERRKKEIKLDEYIGDRTMSSYSEAERIDIRLIELDIEKMNLGLSSIKKQLDDLIIEVESMYSELKKLGSITREEFEEEEQEHFKLSIMKKELAAYAQRLIEIGLDKEAHLSLNSKDRFMSKSSVDEQLFNRIGDDLEYE